MSAEFFVRRHAKEHPESDQTQVFDIPKTLSTGEADFKRAFGVASTLEADLLTIAASVFAVDRAMARGEREDFYRNISVSLPVVNLARLLPLRDNVERVLRLLSDDAWSLEFRPAAGAAERTRRSTRHTGRTLLFSGGLDSLAAALEFSHDASLQLVSHKTHNTVVNSAQQRLASEIAGLGRNVHHHQFFVSSRSDVPGHLLHSEESSQRTRSFVFLVLGALVARRTRHHEVVYLAENGQMAIHLPLNVARIGAFSTHTARPDVLMAMQELLGSALGFELRITNPYVHKTKREVIGAIVQEAPHLMNASNSCWRNARLPAGISHCGACVPCYVRRIAIESYSPDITAYQRDVWNEDLYRLAADDDGRRNLTDLCEFIVRFGASTPEEIMSHWPELYDEHLNSIEVIAMYKRFAAEARAVLGRYPRLAPLLT